MGKTEIIIIHPYIVLFFVSILLVGCGNGSVDSSISISSTEGISTELDDNKPDACYLTPAIGNLYLGVTLDKFKKAKDLFLKDTPHLAGHQIEFVIPSNVIDNRVEEIMILSSEYKLKYSYTPWANLYKEKYHFVDDRFVHNGKLFIVEDNVTWPILFGDNKKMNNRIRPHEGFARSCIRICNYSLYEIEKRETMKDLNNKHQKELSII